MTLDQLILIAADCLAEVSKARAAEDFASVAKYGEALAAAGQDIETAARFVGVQCTDAELVAPLQPEIASEI